MRRLFAWLGKQIDRRDVLGAAGLAGIVYGGETLLPGAGYAAAGAVLAAVAVLVR